MRAKTWWDKRGESYRNLIQKIVENSFVGNSKWVFGNLRRATNYHKYEKREGGFVTQALDKDGRLLTGIKLN